MTDTKDCERIGWLVRVPEPHVLGPWPTRGGSVEHSYCLVPLGPGGGFVVVLGGVEH